MMFPNLVHSAKSAGKGLKTRLSATSSRTFSTTKLPDRQRRFKSHSVKAVERPGFYPVYVHYVSKVALEHLQGAQGDWVVKQGLDSRLTINPNGTFVLAFPPLQGQEAGKVWTSYDAIEKKHWLSVYRQNLAIRFLLKDHGESMNRRVHDSQQIENQIYQAVDQMISTIDQSDISLKFTGDKN